VFKGPHYNVDKTRARKKKKLDEEKKNTTFNQTFRYGGRGTLGKFKDPYTGSPALVCKETDRGNKGLFDEVWEKGTVFQNGKQHDLLGGGN